MGFSLAGFAAGAAEGITTRIEEERKFSAAALQGRIERASIMKQRQEEEEKALIEELRLRKDQLSQMNVSDPQLQVAYLTSPVAFEALKKARDSRIPVDATELITVNKDKLLYKNPDELIASVTARPKGGEPAKLLQPEGGSLFAPSQTQEQRRFEQFASMRGMTLEDVARAESGARVKRPEPVATINYKALEKEDKATWKQKLERFETAYADAVDQFGANSKQATDAKNRVDSYRVTTSNMTEDQMDHAKKLSRAQAIMFDKSMTNVSEQDKKWAEGYLREYNDYKRRQEAAGKQDEKIPTTNSLVSIGRTAGANAVRSTYGASAISKQLSFVTNADGSTSMAYSGTDPDMQKRLIRREQEGVVAALRPYMTQDGRVTDRKIESALQTFGIKLDGDGRPVLSEAPPMPAPPPTAGERRAQPKQSAASAAATPIPASTAASAPAARTGRAGQGGAKPAAVPPKPISVTNAPAGSTVGEYVQGKGYAVYNSKGELIGYAVE